MSFALNLVDRGCGGERWGSGKARVRQRWAKVGQRWGRGEAEVEVDYIRL